MPNDPNAQLPIRVTMPNTVGHSRVARVTGVRWYSLSASGAVQVTRLFRPEFLTEIEAVDVVPKKLGRTTVG